MNIESYDMQYTLEVLCNSLENKPKVYYPRFGDGDFNIMSNTTRNKREYQYGRYNFNTMFVFW